MATLTSTCSLPSAARPCQTERNYPGESHCTAPLTHSHTLSIHPPIQRTRFCLCFLLMQPFRPSISVIFISALPLFSSSLLFLSSRLFSSPFSLLPPSSLSLCEITSLLCAATEITFAFYIFRRMFSPVPLLYVPLSLISPVEKEKKKETHAWKYIFDSHLIEESPPSPRSRHFCLGPRRKR